MADTKQTSDPNEIPPDPIYAQSLSWHISLAMIAVIVAVVVAVLDEIVWRRPYKAHQARYKERLGAHLDTMIQQRVQLQNALMSGDTYQELQQAVVDAEDASRERRDELKVEIDNFSRRIRAVNEALKIANSEIAAFNYSAEHAANAEGVKDVPTSEAAQEYLDKIEAVRDRVIEFTWQKQTPAGYDEVTVPPAEEGGEPTTRTVFRTETATETESGTVREFVPLALALQAKRALLQGELAEVATEVGERVKARDVWLARALADVGEGLNTLDDDGLRTEIAKAVAERGSAAVLDEIITLNVSQLKSLAKSNEEMPTGPILGGELKQIHIAEANNWVDRCETCHMGTRFPMPLTEEAMGERLFISHPTRELLETHDPERFGCSTCHNGNGMAVTSVKWAHGLNKYWLHPLYQDTNIQAGCVQCHDTDLVLDMGERISAAKELYRHKGCWGCHKRDGYDKERDLIRDANNLLGDLEKEIAEKRLEQKNLQSLLDPVFDYDEEAATTRGAEVKAQQQAIQREISGLLTEHSQVSERRQELQRERKRVGPNLKNLKAKVQRGWLTDWVKNPRHFRVDTKMPVFRWENDDEVKAVSAFLWQNANDPADFAALREQLKKQPPGDAANGKNLFEAVGCMSCHAIGEGEAAIGHDFAANLSNLKHKLNYEFLVRWLEDPRRRLLAYDMEQKKDLDTPEATLKATSNDLLWRTHSMMPSLRLSDAEARDIATYLMGETGSGYEPTFDAAAQWLDDAELYAEGKRLTEHLGCAGCHEIKGYEDAMGIGVELTKEGSKPKERLDFGHYTLDAKRGNEPLADWQAPGDGMQIFEDDKKWYTHRGFFMHKLAKPEIYDIGKNLEDRYIKSRMPNFGLSGQEIHDLTTFLLGSVDPQIPESFRHNPEEKGQAIRDGWWVIRKYNCAGCHQIRPDDVPALALNPLFQKDGKHEADLPPSLVGTGYRTDPTWLSRFLHDPSLGGGTEQPKAARPYLDTRMPSFAFTDGEVRALVRFFNAMADQDALYTKPELDPLTSAERRLAEGIFSTDAANCQQCHYLPSVPITTETKAPNLNLFSERLRPEWAHRWIKDPLAMEPTTAMTILFDYDEKADRWVSKFQDKVPGLRDYRNPKYRDDHIWLMIRYLNELKERPRGAR